MHAGADVQPGPLPAAPALANEQRCRPSMHGPHHAPCAQAPCPWLTQGVQALAKVGRDLGRQRLHGRHIHDLEVGLRACEGGPRRWPESAAGPRLTRTFIDQQAGAERIGATRPRSTGPSLPSG